MALHASTSFQWRKVSMMPCMTPPSLPVDDWRAMLDPWTDNSMISGMANRPTVTDTSDKAVPEEERGILPDKRDRG